MHPRASVHPQMPERSRLLPTHCDEAKLGPGHRPELTGVSGHKAQCCSHGGLGPVVLPLLPPFPSLPCMVIHGDGKGPFHGLLLNGTVTGAGESCGPAGGLQGCYAPIPIWVLCPVTPSAGAGLRLEEMVTQ